MNKKNLKFFRELLQKEEQNLTISITEPDQIEQERGDEVDNAQSISLNALTNQFHARSTLYLKKVQAALKRIEEGQFGICISCEDEITLARLKARPTAELCISCKEEQEGKENRNKSGQISKSFAISRGIKI